MTAIGYYIFILIVRVFNLFPLKIIYLKSDVIFFFIYYIIPYRKKVVRQNLVNSFPEKSDKEISRIMKKHYRYFCDLFLETIMLYRMKDTELIKRVVYKNPEVIDEIYESGKSMSIIIGHYCNWEWLSSLALITDFNVLAIYKPLNNKYFDRFMIRLRERFGQKAVPMASIARDLVKARQENRQVAVYFVADQSPLKSEIKRWVTFLNQDTGVFSGPEKIAKRNDHAMVFFKMSRPKRGYYDVEVIKLFESTKDVSDEEITLSHIKTLEEIIKERPEYWLWTHRRWKHKKTDA